MRRFGKRMINESNNPDHYSGDTFYIKRKDPNYGIFKVEINEDDLGLEDIIGDITSDWIPCANLRNGRSTLDGLFDNSDAEDVVRKALESDSSNKKLYTIDWNVDTSRPWIDYDEVDLTDSEYEEFVNDFKNDEYADFGVFGGNAIAFCDDETIGAVVGNIEKYMQNGSCGFNIEKVELDIDEESLVESDDVSENDSCYGFINDGESVVDGIVDYFGHYDEIDEEDAIKELQDKANYEREEDDGMRESVMRSRLLRGRMLREGRRPRGRMMKESAEDKEYVVLIDGEEVGETFKTIEDAKKAAEHLWGRGEEGSIEIYDTNGEFVDEFIKESRRPRGRMLREGRRPIHGDVSDNRLNNAIANAVEKYGLTRCFDEKSGKFSGGALYCYWVNRGFLDSREYNTMKKYGDKYGDCFRWETNDDPFYGKIINIATKRMREWDFGGSVLYITDPLAQKIDAYLDANKIPSKEEYYYYLEDPRYTFNGI